MAKKQIPINNDELANLQGKSGKDFTKMFKSSAIASTDTLNLLYLNGRDNVIGRFVEEVKQLESIDPGHPLIEEYIKSAGNLFEGTISSVQDVIDAIYDYFEYYHAIKTEEQLAYEFERAKKFVEFPNSTIQVVVQFDYQFYTKASIFQKPTFYSYYNDDIETEYGTGAYCVAFPSSQALLTDDEVRVAMKHEMGHIVQGHCGATLRTNFEKIHSNQAMDISINLGMTEAEQALLVTLAHKIWKNNSSYPCLSLEADNGQGGFNIPRQVRPLDWRGTLGWIEAFAKKKDGGTGGGGTGGGGGGGGGTPGNEPPKQPEIQKVKVGDYIKVIGSEPAIYGRVTSVDDITGNIETKDYTVEEWDVIKKSM